MLNNKSILVTGGTGSFGKKFILTIFKKFTPKKVIVFSRDELKQYQMQQMDPFKIHEDKIRYFIGDVRDARRLEMAFENVDCVIHAAALKQVPAAEYNPFEAIKTNIHGAQNVIEAALKNNVKLVVALSTDKAAAPINLYGATKLVSDKLFISANNYRGFRDVKFSVVRYGNVMGSRGSVIPLFLSRKTTGFIPITDDRMTRFNITLQQGVDFVLDVLLRMYGGEIFVPKIPSYKILDLADAIAPECKIKVIGIRPGEKIHEEMITESDSINTIEFDKYFVILPTAGLCDKDVYIGKCGTPYGKFCEYGFKYSSDTNRHFLSKDDLKTLLKENRIDLD
ncbi:MAG: UDP-N-acetylglucosamine 4,6-dehydratase (inverting) [Oligoflexia bacterium]|nr:UDP-N-acetylglucosamine 4,6-dehydratase (inverting) [Oligoflexia bacterium]